MVNKDNKTLAVIIFFVFTTLFSFVAGTYFLMLYFNDSSTIHSIPNQVVVTSNYLDAVKIYANQTYLPIDDTWYIDSINSYFASQKEYSLLLVKYSNGTHTTYRLYFGADDELKIFG